MKVKEESEKDGWKLNIQKTKIMASGPITSWEIDGETVETVANFILGGSKITVAGDCSHEIKRCLLLGRKAMTNLSSVQLLSHVWLFETPWTAALQASLSITNSRSLLRLMSVESVMPSNHLIFCHPLLLLPSIYRSIRVFFQFFASGGQSIGASASASVHPMNIQYWFPLGLTGLIFLQSEGLSRVFSNTTVEKHQFFSAQLSL